ncbi:MAG: TRAP transporter substrate-binding protein [Calditrichaeota bacterium]|nr:TRAP transporter substrate-binding protein [Calditrichota bacterium]
MSGIKRRQFLGTLGKAVIWSSPLLAMGCARQNEAPSGKAPAVITNKTFEWKMVTTWPPHFPALGEGAEHFARWVEDMSAGRLKIKVYGGGELVPPLQVFDAVSQGVAEMGHGASYYWAGKAPAAQFFAAVPFGMNAQQMHAWIDAGGGMELWRELYAQFNLVPFPGGNTGVQMGGWFNKEIHSLEDLKGLKMRIPGLGGKVIAKAGGSAILSAGGEIYTNLERGVIDATEWIGPYHDYLMGFHRIAKYYYYPGWHEPGTVTELICNKAAFEQLPTDLQHIIRVAAWRLNTWVLSEFESKNTEYLQKILAEGKVQIKKFPDDVLEKFRQLSQEVIQEVVEKDPFSKKVYQSFHQFQQRVGEWATVSEKMYYNVLMR